LIPLSDPKYRIKAGIKWSERGKPDERGLRPLSLRTPTLKLRRASTLLLRWIKVKMQRSGKEHGRIKNQYLLLKKQAFVIYWWHTGGYFEE